MVANSERSRSRQSISFMLARRALIDTNMGVDRLWHRNGVESFHPLAAATVRCVRAARVQPMLRRHSHTVPKLGRTIAPAGTCGKAKIKTATRNCWSVAAMNLVLVYAGCSMNRGRVGLSG